MRKKSLLEGIKDDFLEQFKGFPPQIQELGQKVFNRADPVYKRVRYEVAVRQHKGRTSTINLAKSRLRQVPFNTPYTGQNAFPPGPKKKRVPTGLEADFRKLVNPKTYQTPGMPADGSIPEYLIPKKKVKVKK